jgi:capsular polysaccharide transport system permease protein
MQKTVSARTPQVRLPGLRVIFALIMREMSTTYGRSAGGYIWAILEPIGAIALMSVVFSFAFRSPALGHNFPLFYATGYLPFMFYVGTSTNIATSIRFNKQLLFYPRVTYIDSIFARFLLSFLTHVLVFYIIIIGIFVFLETRSTLKFQYIFSAFSMAATLSFGVGVLNCFLFEVFPSWQRVWAVLNRPMFILASIFFTIESVPQSFREPLLYNPLVHIVSEMRRGFYPYYDGVYVSHVYVYGISALLTGIGLFLLRRYNKDILDI